MNISELITELERMREMHGDLTVTKARNGEEVTSVYWYGAYQCLLHSEVDDLMDEIVRFTDNYRELRRISSYILNQGLVDVINELRINKDDFKVDIETIPMDMEIIDEVINYPYLTIEIWNDSHKQALKQIKEIHTEYDYCLKIIYHSSTDYDIKTYELPVKPDKVKLMNGMS